MCKSTKCPRPTGMFTCTKTSGSDTKGSTTLPLPRVSNSSFESETSFIPLSTFISRTITHSMPTPDSFGSSRTPPGKFVNGRQVPISKTSAEIQSELDAEAEAEAKRRRIQVCPTTDLAIARSLYST